jgi:hypothetical protein
LFVSPVHAEQVVCVELADKQAVTSDVTCADVHAPLYGPRGVPIAVTV